MRHLASTWRAAGNFALRRQVRLDPRYYVVMAGVLLIAWAEARAPGLEARTFDASHVLLNMVYLQDIVGVPAVLAVAWTLCIEVQFYMVLMLVMLALRRFRAPDSRSTQTTAVRAVVLVLGAVSMVMPWLGWSTGPWFLGYWWMFALGMVISWVLIGEMRIRTGWAVVAVVALWCMAMNLQAPEAIGGYWAAWATPAFLLIAVQTGFIQARAPRPLALLGAWTYSLYLIHLTVIDVVMGGLFKLGGNSVVAAWLAYVVGAVASLIAAWLLYTVVEKRSLVWAQGLKPAPRHTPVEVGPGQINRTRGS